MRLVDIERKGDRIDIRLTAEEVYRIQSGGTIGDRPFSSVTMPDAKVEVLPLSRIDPFDDSLKDKWSFERLDKAKKAPLKGFVWPDGDLQIFVPAIKLTDVRLASARLPRESLIAPGTEDKKSLIEHVIPQDGIRLNFGGSLKTINIPDFFA